MDVTPELRSGTGHRFALSRVPSSCKLSRGTGVFAIDYRAGRAFANELWLSWGYTVEDMLAGTLLDIVHPRGQGDDRIPLPQAHLRRGGLLRGRVPDPHERRADGMDRGALRCPRKGWRRQAMAHRRPRRGCFRHPRRSGTNSGPADFEIETLKDLIEGIRQSLDLRKTIDLVMDRLRRVIHFDRASVQLVEGRLPPRHRELRLRGREPARPARPDRTSGQSDRARDRDEKSRRLRRSGPGFSRFHAGRPGSDDSLVARHSSRRG